MKNVRLSGPHEVTLYTYIGGPLAYVETGERVSFDIVAARGKIKSELTGTVTDAARDEGLILAYDGHPVGVMFFAYNALAPLVDAGVPVRVEGVKTGMYSETIPTITLFLPESKTLYTFADEQGMGLIRQARREGLGTRQVKQTPVEQATRMEYSKGQRKLPKRTIAMFVLAAILFITPFISRNGVSNVAEYIIVGIIFVIIGVVTMRRGK